MPASACWRRAWRWTGLCRRASPTVWASPTRGGACPGGGSYFDVLAKPWFNFPYHLTDLQAAFEAWTKGGNRLRLTGYTGRDALDLSDVGDNPLPIEWAWGNDAVGGSWTNPMRAGGSMDVRAYFSRFTSDFEFVETESRFTSDVQEASFQADLEQRPTGRTRWKSGIAAKRLAYDNESWRGGTVFNESAGSGWEAAAYSQIHWDPNSRWLVEGGLRVDHWRPDRGRQRDDRVTPLRGQALHPRPERRRASGRGTVLPVPALASRRGVAPRHRRVGAGGRARTAGRIGPGCSWAWRASSVRATSGTPRWRLTTGPSTG